MSTLIEQAHSREWFYSYDLPDGSTTPTYHGSDIKAIHDTRWQMLESCLDENLGPDRAACRPRPGFSPGLVRRQHGACRFSRVLGIDARQSHVDDSQPDLRNLWHGSPVVSTG